MAVVRYRCPTSGEYVTTSIETSDETLARMSATGLIIWAWCPQCMSGHQIKAADATLQTEIEANDTSPMAEI